MLKKKNMLKRKEHYGSDKILIYFIEKQKLKYLKRKTSCTWELELHVLNEQLKFMSKK